MRNLIARAWTRNSPDGRPPRLRPYAVTPFTPSPPEYPVAPLARMVRPYVLEAERRRETERVDRSRLGLAVLLDMSRMEAVVA